MHGTSRCGRFLLPKRRTPSEQLIDLIVARRSSRSYGMRVYHYAPYEPSAMKRLMGKYATRADEAR